MSSAAAAAAPAPAPGAGGSGSGSDSNGGGPAGAAPRPGSMQDEEARCALRAQQAMLSSQPRKAIDSFTLAISACVRTQTEGGKGEAGAGGGEDVGTGTGQKSKKEEGEENKNKEEEEAVEKEDQRALEWLEKGGEEPTTEAAQVAVRVAACMAEAAQSVAGVVVSADDVSESLEKPFCWSDDPLAGTGRKVLTRLLEYYSCRSGLLWSDGDKELALEDAQRAVQIAPEWPTAWLCKGRALYSLRRYGEAIEALDCGLANDPAEPALLHMLRKIMYVAPSVAPRRIWDENALLMPDARHEKSRGNAHFKGKEYHEALVHYETALDTQPVSLLLWSNKAITHLELKEYSEALDAAQEAVKIGELTGADAAQFAKAHRFVARAQLKLGESALALESLYKAQAIRNTPTAQRTIEKIHGKLSETEKAQWEARGKEIMAEIEAATAHHNGVVTLSMASTTSPEASTAVTVTSSSPSVATPYPTPSHESFGANHMSVYDKPPLPPSSTALATGGGGGPDGDAANAAESSVEMAAHNPAFWMTGNQEDSAAVLHSFLLEEMSALDGAPGPGADSLAHYNKRMRASLGVLAATCELDVTEPTSKSQHRDLVSRYPAAPGDLLLRERPFLVVLNEGCVHEYCALCCGEIARGCMSPGARGRLQSVQPGTRNGPVDSGGSRSIESGEEDVSQASDKHQNSGDAAALGDDGGMRLFFDNVPMFPNAFCSRQCMDAFHPVSVLMRKSFQLVQRSPAVLQHVDRFTLRAMILYAATRSVWSKEPCCPVGLMQMMQLDLFDDLLRMEGRFHAHRKTEFLRTMSNASFRVHSVLPPDLRSSTTVNNLLHMMMKRNVHSVNLTNSQGRCIGNGLLIAGAALRHSCDANADYVFNPSRGCVEVRAMRTIGANEVITVPFINPASCRSARLQYFQQAKNIRCNCKRCSPAMVPATAPSQVATTAPAMHPIDAWLEGYACARCHQAPLLRRGDVRPSSCPAASALLHPLQAAAKVTNDGDSDEAAAGNGQGAITAAAAKRKKTAQRSTTAERAIAAARAEAISAREDDMCCPQCGWSCSVVQCQTRLDLACSAVRLIDALVSHDAQTVHPPHCRAAGAPGADHCHDQDNGVGCRGRGGCGGGGDDENVDDDADSDDSGGSDVHHSAGTGIETGVPPDVAVAVLRQIGAASDSSPDNGALDTRLSRARIALQLLHQFLRDHVTPRVGAHNDGGLQNCLARFAPDSSVSHQAAEAAEGLPLLCGEHVVVTGVLERLLEPTMTAAGAYDLYCRTLQHLIRIAEYTCPHLAAKIPRHLAQLCLAFTRLRSYYGDALPEPSAAPAKKLRDCRAALAQRALDLAQCLYVGPDFDDHPVVELCKGALRDALGADTDEAGSGPADGGNTVPGTVAAPLAVVPDADDRDSDRPVVAC